MGATKAAPRTSRVTCPPDHKHGETVTCYRHHHCGCDDCREGVARISRDYRRKIAYQRPTTNLIPAEPVRQHVNYLRSAGMGLGRIAELSGVPTHIFRSLYNSVNGRQPTVRIRSTTAAAILNVLPDPNLMLRHDPRGTQRRIQALATQGWSTVLLGERMGVSQQAVHALLSVKWVSPETFERVRDLYEELWDKEPPQGTPHQRKSVTFVKRRAAKHRWVPPLAWDDIDADPQPPRAPRYNPQKLDVVERERRVEKLHALHWSDARIAREIGAADRTVLRIRQRLGLPGWTKEQQEAAA